MNRKDFIKSTGKVCIGSCLCTMGIQNVIGQEGTGTEPGADTPARAVKRMKFADIWIKRFFDVLDTVLDDESKRRVMMTNGKICFQEWIRSQGRKIVPVSLETWADRVKNRLKDGSIRIEDNVIYFQYTGSAETGKESPESVCLCSMVESKPAGLSPTYCLCSVGYVKEMFDQTFGRSVEVTLVDSVLYGAKRCQFKITVPET